VKKVLLLAMLLASSTVKAGNMEASAEKLTGCLFSYADSQLGTQSAPEDISSRAFNHCANELKDYRSSIGPDASQWEGLDESQRQAIERVRDNTTAKLSESLSKQIADYVMEQRKGS
jgi:hypothetical protein